MPSEPGESGSWARMERPCCRAVGRAGVDVRPIPFDHHPAVRFGVVGRADHVHFEVHVEEVTGHRERRSPLARTRLGCQRCRARLFVVERLRHGRVRLVGPDRADPFVLVVDVGGRIERLLQPVGAEERGRPPQLVDVAHRLRNLNVPLGADLLHDQRHREEHAQEVGRHRLQRAGMQHRLRRHGHIGVDVVPCLWQLAFVQQKLCFVAHRYLRLKDVVRQSARIMPTKNAHVPGQGTRALDLPRCHPA